MGMTSLLCVATNGCIPCDGSCDSLWLVSRRGLKHPEWNINSYFQLFHTEEDNKENLRIPEQESQYLLTVYAS